VRAWRTRQGAFGTDGRGDIDNSYYAICTLDIVGQLKPEQAVLRLIAVCGNSDGGLGNRPGLRSRLDVTYCGVRMLRLLSGTVRAQRQLVSWVKSCRSGEGFSLWPGGSPHVGAAYWGL